MKKYKVIKPVMLTMLTPQDSYDASFHPADNDYILECNGSTIWVWSDYIKWETITTANAIDIWLEQGKIEEIEEV